MYAEGTHASENKSQARYTSLSVFTDEALDKPALVADSITHQVYACEHSFKDSSPHL